MILMGFNYCINSLKFIKSVQLTASFQQVRFSSIKFQVQKKIWHVYNAMSVLLTSDFIFIKMSCIEDSVCFYSFIPSFFQVNLSVSCVGNGDQNFEYTFYTIIWLTQSARETWSFGKDLFLGRLTQSVSRELFLYFIL